LLSAAQSRLVCLEVRRSHRGACALRGAMSSCIAWLASRPESCATQGPGGGRFALIPKKYAPPVTHGLGRTPVYATVDGVSWDTSVWRDRTHGALLAVPKKVRGAKGRRRLGSGDTRAPLNPLSHRSNWKDPAGCTADSHVQSSARCRGRDRQAQPPGAARNWEWNWYQVQLQPNMGRGGWWVLAVPKSG
jgi:Domain of unknown function (DUF1905)